MALANVAGSYESGLRTPQPLAGIANAIDQSGDSISDMIYKKHMEQLQAHTNQLIMDFQKQKQGAEFKQQSDLETQKQAGAMALQKAKMAGSNIGRPGHLWPSKRRQYGEYRRCRGRC